MTIDELKKALGNYFYKDLSRFEPGRKGIVIGETVRIALGDDDSVSVRFLYGTPPAGRQPILNRLEAVKVKYVLEGDFRS